jgi:NADPH-dependent 2,4-dienoyl-CoA reductase/sulfur reductase-like enzyme
MEDVDYLLIGGGPASATAAHTLRSEGARGRIVMLCAESVPPYNRPGLIKRFLTAQTDPQRLASYPDASYAQSRIETRLGATATHVDPGNRVVETASGPAFRYGKLLLATGGAAKPLAVPNAALSGIHYLHGLADARSLREAALNARRAVIVGASFVGLEMAEWLVGQGIEVTILESGDRVLSALRAMSVSNLFRQLCTARGVKVQLGVTVARFQGSERIEHVVTTTGAIIDCDLVVAAIGIVPHTEFLAGSGIETHDGVLVDAFLQTSHPDVFAAGDVARFDDSVFRVSRRIEHWDNAVRQGRIAARNMLGKREPYREVSMYFGDMFGVSFNFLGAADDDTATIERGAFGSDSFALLYMKGDALQASFSVARPAEETQATETLIRYRTDLASYRAQLGDLDFELASIPSQTVLILQGGGALGAFECGAMRALQSRGVIPDVVAAVSIGAFNGAIIASNPGCADEALSAFWKDVSIGVPDALVAQLGSAFVFWYVLSFGVPHLCVPRWLSMPYPLLASSPWWTSLYDTTPAIKLIERYVDFARLKTSPIRLLISAVDVASGDLRIFDSYVDDLTPQHLLASGSLPPGFPWTFIDNHAYWDGGIVSNSPLDLVVERCGSIGRRVFIVDLFSGARPLPTNLLEVLLRRDEIVYTDRVRNDLRIQEYANDVRALVTELTHRLSEDEARKLRHHPQYIRLMGNRAPTQITCIALTEGAGEGPAKDYDFSESSIRRLQQRGFEAALAALVSVPYVSQGELDDRQAGAGRAS